MRQQEEEIVQALWQASLRQDENRKRWAENLEQTTDGDWYLIARSRDPMKLAAKINAAVVIGYRPIGGVSAVQVRFEDDGWQVLYCQAMWREPKE